jgi:hypothetical protein
MILPSIVLFNKMVLQNKWSYSKGHTVMDEEIRAYIGSKLRSQYFGYKLVRHSRHEDYVEKKGWLFPKPTGISIRKEDMRWKAIDVTLKAQRSLLGIGGQIHSIDSCVYVHVDEVNKIVLYRF